MKLIEFFQVLVDEVETEDDIEQVEIYKRCVLDIDNIHAFYEGVKDNRTLVQMGNEYYELNIKYDIFKLMFNRFNDINDLPTATVGLN